MNKGTVLVVDDDRSIRSYLSDFLTSSGYSVVTAQAGDEALSRLSDGFAPDVVLLDVVMPGMPGIDVLAKAREIAPATPVIMLSAVDQTKTVVQAMRTGASDYLCKPFEDEELILSIESAIEKQQLREEVKNLRQKLDRYERNSDILSSSPRILKIKEIARHVADVDVPVLILGESGVGKEVVAQYIHAQSNRADKPFVKVNCAALPHDLLESELFGYEKGAFTGAQGEKPGKFELANHGTILLDEIGEMSPQLQAKLLHVLQDGEYTRLGGRRPARVDARVLASTNRRLAEAVANSEFREDLYFRLNVIRLEVPPLRERPEDIPLLSRYFFEKYHARYNSSVPELPQQLVDAFARCEWPGNVRQLENVVKRFLILADMDSVMSELAVSTDVPAPAPAPSGMPLKELSAHVAEQAERDAVLKALESTNWNRKKAAGQLGICYKALLNKLKKWQIDNRTPRQPDTASGQRN